MLRRLLGGVGLVLLVAAAEPADDVKAELEKFQGEWVMASGTRDGKDLPAAEAAKMTRVIKGDQFVLMSDGKEVAKGSFKVDPTKKPKTIDVRRAEEGAKPVLGIYELDGGTQKVCIGAPGKDRPTAFESKEGSGNLLSVWKRKK
jgi:uncharacterized protein (TIGR03067 family)